MAASGTAVGLSGPDVEHIREALAAGRKPKVVFTASAGQIAGQAGQVVGLTDPKASDEWVVVRFGKDELPFSPADLAVPVRGASKRRADAAPAPSPEFKLDTKVPTPRARAVPAKSALNGAKPKATGPASSAVTSEVRARREDDAAKAPRPARAERAQRSRVPQPLTVTLSYADREWTVAARLGSKVLAKPYGIKPAEALRMVSLLDVPGVHDAVESIIAAERVEAEDQARRLRSELAEIEARLAELTGRA
jgi:hypothetical protein